MNYDETELRIWLPNVRVYVWVQSWDCQLVADRWANGVGVNEFNAMVRELMLHGF